MSLQTTTEITSAVSEFYYRTLLERAMPLLTHELFGQLRPLDTRNGLLGKFRRYEKLSTTITPLTQGVPPASTDPTKTDITATVKTYGAYIEYTDDVELTTPDPILTEFNTLLGEQAGESIDILRRDTLVAGTSVSYANGTTRVGLTSAITLAVLQKAHRTLRANNANWIRSYLSASTNVGTTPIRSSYVAIVHPHVGYDVRNLTGFKGVEEYGTMQAIHESEIGSIPSAGIRFLESTQAKVWIDAGGTAGSTLKSTGASQADVYGTLIFGMNAYGLIPLRGNALTTHLKARGTSGAADALDQIGTTGWKAKTTQVILNDNFMVRVESAASA